MLCPRAEPSGPHVARAAARFAPSAPSPRSSHSHYPASSQPGPAAAGGVPPPVDKSPGRWDPAKRSFFSWRCRIYSIMTTVQPPWLPLNLALQRFRKWLIRCPTADGLKKASHSMTQLEEYPLSGATITAGDMALEVVVIPVSDVDRAKTFYDRLGWRLDADFRFANGFRVVQFTPRGSDTSIQFGTNMTSAISGSAQGLYLVVADIKAAREELVARGVNVSNVFHPSAPGAQFQPEGATARLIDPSPDHVSYGSFATFSDPDGNSWLLQEVTNRLPGRLDTGRAKFALTADLATALRRAAAAHGEHEKRIGQPDPNWPDWYAAYIVAIQNGEKLPQ